MRVFLCVGVVPVIRDLGAASYGDCRALPVVRLLCLRPSNVMCIFRLFFRQDAPWGNSSRVVCAACAVLVCNSVCVCACVCIPHASSVCLVCMHRMHFVLV